MRSFYWLAAVLALLAATAHAPPVRAVAQGDVPLYTLTDLGTLGGANSQAYAINAQGRVAGWSETGAADADGTPIRRAFYWDNPYMRPLGTLGGDHSAAFGLNDRGWVVGTAGRARGETVAALWNEDIVDLGYWWQDRYRHLGTSTANAVNDRGQIAGGAVAETTSDNKAVIFHRGRIQFPHPKWIVAEAVAINKHGVAAGWVENPGVGPWSQIWPGDRILLKRRRHCDYGNTCWDKAYGINDRKQVVGASERGAYLWHRGRITWLGMLPGHSRSRANDVNNHGQIVGVSGVADGSLRGEDYVEGRALLWHGRRMLDLNKLISPGTAWELEEARAINDRGEIVGWGFPSGRAAGVRHAFLLKPR